MSSNENLGLRFILGTACIAVLIGVASWLAVENWMSGSPAQRPHLDSIQRTYPERARSNVPGNEKNKRTEQAVPADTSVIPITWLTAVPPFPDSPVNMFWQSVDGKIRLDVTLQTYANVPVPANVPAGAYVIKSAANIELIEHRVIVGLNIHVGVSLVTSDGIPVIAGIFQAGVNFKLAGTGRSLADELPRRFSVDATVGSLPGGVSLDSQVNRYFHRQLEFNEVDEVRSVIPLCRCSIEVQGQSQWFVESNPLENRLPVTGETLVVGLNVSKNITVKVTELVRGDWKAVVDNLQLLPVGPQGSTVPRNGYIFSGIIESFQLGMNPVTFEKCAVVYEGEVNETGFVVLRFELSLRALLKFGGYVFKLYPARTFGSPVAAGIFEISEAQIDLEIEAFVPGNFHQIEVLVKDELGQPCPDFLIQMEIKFGAKSANIDEKVKLRSIDFQLPTRQRTDVNGVATFKAVPQLSSGGVRLRTVTGTPRVVKSDIPPDGMVAFEPESRTKTYNIVVSDARIRPFQFSIKFSGENEKRVAQLRAGVYYMLIPVSGTPASSAGYASGTAKFNDAGVFITEMTFGGEYSLILFGSFGVVTKSVKYDPANGQGYEVSIASIRTIVLHYPELATTATRVLPMAALPQVVWSMAMKDDIEFITRFGNNIFDQNGDVRVQVNDETPPVRDWFFFRAGIGLFHCRGTSGVDLEVTVSGVIPIASGTIVVRIDPKHVNKSWRVFLCVTGSFTRSAGKDLVLTEFGWQGEVTGQPLLKLQHVPAGAYAVAAVFCDSEGHAVQVDTKQWYTIIELASDKELSIELPVK